MNKIIFLTMFIIGVFVFANISEASYRDTYKSSPTSCANGACSKVKDVTVDVKRDRPVLAPVKKIKAKTTVKTETTEVKVEAEVVGLPHPVKRVGGLLKRIFGR